MTLFCPLNKPQCKRSVMTGPGPFIKQECPLSKQQKCLFAPNICPMIPQPEGECFLKKMQEVASKGCSGRPQPRLQCCSVGSGQQQPKRNENIILAEKPPCTRCTVGETRELAKIKWKKKPPPKKGSLLVQEMRDRLNKSSKVSEETQRSPSPIPNETHILKRSPKIKSGTSKMAKDNSYQELPRIPPDEREEIFKDAIASKVKELKASRDHLVVPQCSTASRRPMPCASCLLALLSPPDSNMKNDTSRVYKKSEPFVCPFMRIMSMCGDNCACPEVTPVDDEDIECPFLSMNGKSASSPKTLGCPLSRIEDNPFIQDSSNIPNRGQPFQPSKCPVIPGNCCYTAPGCSVHTTKETVDCRCS